MAEGEDTTEAAAFGELLNLREPSMEKLDLSRQFLVSLFQCLGRKQGIGG